MTRKKIWRAFPELDQFDDAICKKFVRRAKLLDNSRQEPLLFLLAFGCAFFVWIFFVGIIQSVHFEVAKKLGWQLPSIVRSSFFVIGFSGVLWFPMLSGLIVRDRWLRHCIRKLFSLSECAACGYSLIGLAIVEREDGRGVRCPECGLFTTLNIGYITEFDIDPTFLNKSESSV
ncbi:MAG: hypothetical protein JKX70_02350 [Phycisphaerales bacterium]|nr:hypothetical protein [Phycisphaerales bacterium]